MPNITRRRDPEAQQETWLIHYGDVRVGVIAERVGNPDSTPLAMELWILPGRRTSRTRKGPCREL
jgi:hypothetical protein